VGALLAVVAYGAAAFALYHLVGPVLDRDAHPGAVAAVAAAPGETGLTGAGGLEALALRAAASRVQHSVYIVEGPGDTHGSGFVAWTQVEKISFVLTARAVVAEAPAEDAHTVYVKHHGLSWPARIVRADRTTGLALLRVNTVLRRPLWQAPDGRESPPAGAPAVVVPAGKEAPLAAGTLSGSSGRFSLQSGDEAAYLGAPVVADDGSLSGIVVGVTEGGATRVASLSAVCSAFRGCH
jgi:hypothetical protein